MKKILIANRGEIAVRILRTCRDMGIATVAVYSDCDRRALHVRMADQAFSVGEDRASESYLRIDKLIDVARRSGADGVHPGYGFLAENPEFAEACGSAGLTFIGPSPDAMTLMASKTAARQVAIGAGVPVVPGSTSLTEDADAAAMAIRIGYPLLVKAVAGGGGKGMRVVRVEEELEAAVRVARSEAGSAFGNSSVYFERLVERPRHIEVQLLGDHHGTVIPFVERECSIQRRHQKLVEETPSPVVTAELRATLAAAASAIGRAAGYASAGTIEFLLDATGRYYFLEMNTRLQVEHPVTEAVTGIDFVRMQIEIARGREIGGLGFAAADGAPRPASGHAIECRVYAEDPDEGFMPSPGLITHLRPPSGPGVRDDSGALAGWVVPSAYDPLISKVITWGTDRAHAIARMVRALAEYEVRGIKTTIGFCHELMTSESFAAGDFDTTSVDRRLEDRRTAQQPDLASEELAAIAAAFDAHRASSAPRREARTESLWARQGRVESLR